MVSVLVQDYGLLLILLIVILLNHKFSTLLDQCSFLWVILGADFNIAQSFPLSQANRTNKLLLLWLCYPFYFLHC